MYFTFIRLCLIHFPIRNAHAGVNIECPPDVTIECGDPTDPSATGTPECADSLIFSDVVSGDCPQRITRTWTCTDEAGNVSSCNQEISVQDTTPPLNTAPPDATLGCGDPTDPSATGQATCSDSCDPAPTRTFNDAVSGDCPQTITRTWTCTDACGNVSSTSQIITLNREINVRVIAICASPVAGEPHEGDPFKCLCFGGPLNGYNATMSPDGINCPRRTIGPFCFVTEDFMPLYWKETVRNQSGPTTVGPGDIVQAVAECPPGKMVISCQGAVTVGDTNEPAANVARNIFPTADGLACRYVARTDRETGPTGCAHSPTTGGVALDPACDPGVACVCALDDNCCTDFWDERCGCEYECWNQYPACGTDFEDCSANNCVLPP
jgi:hypothetical protein